jgi:protein-L-isoaspartate(D-aspartate) O-methyltransferase
MRQSAAEARFNMVESQIRPFSVTDEKVLKAFRQTPREQYVPANMAAQAYQGEELNVGNGRFMIEAPAYARLIQGAELAHDAHVLDIGCSQGYSSAILAQVAGSVVAIDSEEWIAQAKKIKHDKITFVAGKLAEGVKAKAPYDAIFINGSVQNIPQALVDQLAEGGVIATFRRENGGQAVLYRKIMGTLQTTILFDAFVPVLKEFTKEESFVF